MQQDTHVTTAQLNEQELQAIMGGMCDQCKEIKRKASYHKNIVENKVNWGHYAGNQEGLREARNKASKLGDLISDADASINKAASNRLGVCEDFAKHSNKLSSLT